MKKLLVIHHGALGDVALTFPAIIRLRKTFARIDLLCQDQLGKAARALGMADGSFPLESALFASLWSDVPAPEAKRILNDYDKVLLFSFSEHLERAVAGITGGTPCRVPPRPGVREDIHVGEHILSGLSKCGLWDGDKDPDALSHEDRRHPGHDPKKILLHPGSGSRRKNWPLPNFLEVGRLLEAEGMRPEFVMGPAEDFSEAMTKEDKSLIVHRIPDITEMIALFRGAGGFVGNDSGLTHLAAFMGLPTVAVFGPSDPLRWRPLGKSVSVIASSGCRRGHCFETTRKDCETPECLWRTNPEMVVRAFRSIWEGVRKLHFRTFSHIGGECGNCIFAHETDKAKPCAPAEGY